MLLGLFGLSACLFATGLTLMLTRRHALLMVLGAELMFISAGFNFVLADPHPAGQGPVAALVVLVVSTCETVLALAILMRVHHRYKTLETYKLRHLQERLGTP